MSDQLEALHIYLDKDDLFRDILDNSLPQGSEITICTKKHATVGGMPGAVIQFTTVIDNKPVSVQATITVRNLLSALVILQSAYPEIKTGLAIFESGEQLKGN